MRRSVIFPLCAALIRALVSGCAGQKGYKKAENCIDPVKLYQGLGEIASNGGLVGVSY